MRRTRISIVCAALLAALPASAEAGGIGSVVGAVANAPRALLGGLFGGGRARPHRHHARHTARERPVARATQRPVARATPAIPAETKPTDRGTAAFWPSAYDDVFGYVLSPAGYDNAFWSRGYANVVEAMFAPSAADIAGNKRGPTGASVVSGKSDDFVPAPVCAEAQNSGAAIERMERMVQPVGAQRAAIDELGNALRAAAERVRVACATDLSGGPGARLETMWRRLRALRQAAIMVRASLRNFYDSLNDDQKARLDTAAQDGPGMRTPQTREAGSGDPLRACSENARMPEWPMGPIAQAIQLNDDQRPMLELLMGTSLHYAHQLRASCPAAPALTPTARLEAVDQRLSAMVYAVTVLRGTLNKFYNSLSEEQRARFDAMSSVARPAERRRAEVR